MSTYLYKKIFLVAAIVAVLAGVTGEAHADAGHASSASIGVPGKPSQATRTITVNLRDIAYDQKSISVKAGETVRFVLKNTGEFLHEFNIGTAEKHANHQKEMMKMMEMGMLTPTSMNMDMDHSKTGMAPMKHDDPNSVLIEPGKTKELVWKFAKAAKLEFACNIPGHYESGMAGEFKFGE